MRIITRLLAICLAVLIGTGLQQFVTMGETEYELFTTTQWIFQSIFWITCVCIGLIIEESQMSK
jgi:hypothetical protein